MSVLSFKYDIIIHTLACVYGSICRRHCNTIKISPGKQRGGQGQGYRGSCLSPTPIWRRPWIRIILITTYSMSPYKIEIACYKISHTLTLADIKK